MVSTVAILAQGTSLALASQQAFCISLNLECGSMAKAAAVATAGQAHALIEALEESQHFPSSPFKEAT